MFIQVIQKIASVLYRDRQVMSPEAQMSHDKKLAVFFSGALIATLGLFLYYFILDAANWYDMAPQVAIEKREWQVLIDPNETLPLSHSSLWNSAKSLTEADTAAVLKSGKVKKVWLKLSVPAEKIKKANELEAFYYRIGFLIGDVRIWVDDDQLVSIPSHYTGSLELALPIYKMNQGQAMSLIISIVPREGARNLVPLTLGIDSGFVAYQTGAAFMRFNHFINRSRPMALFFVYSLFSLIFFVLWNSNRVQREYLHLAVFALTNSLPPILFSDAFTTGRLHDTSAYIVYLSLVIAQAGAALSLGLSFARSQSKRVTQSIWGFVGLGILVVLLLPQEIRSVIRQPLNQVLMPFSFAVGALACFAQMSFLKSSESGLSQPRRVKRLKSFGFILALLCVLYYVEFHSDLDYVTKQLLFDFPALSLIVFLGYIALVDYRHQSQLIKRIPLSEYHRRTQLPERIRGAVVILDLKNSEKYFSYAKQMIGFESVMPTVLSHIWSGINKSGGTILKAEGDEVVAFFESHEHANPVLSALTAMDQIAVQLKNYSEEIQCQYEGFDNQSLHFRAAVALGEIRPIWIEGASGRLPAWVQVGSSMVFVEASRLLEIEKQVERESSELTSRVLVQSVNRSENPIDESLLSGKFIIMQKSYHGKHDRLYIVDVYRPVADKRSSLRLVG
ncbi:MAG: hypothetical protein ACXVAX_06750 [Pseudobdellovibrio sp.]